MATAMSPLVARPRIESAGVRRRRLPPLPETPENDALIRDAYARSRLHNDRGAITRLAARLGRRVWTVRRRGAQLGLARVKERPWSEAELAIIEHYAWQSDRSIVRRLRAAGFSRTEAAVHLKIQREKLKEGVDGYSQRQLAEALGASPHTLRLWARQGWLRGTRRGTERTDSQGADMLYFSRAVVRSFVMKHPDEIDLWKVEKFWFLDLLTNGRICR
jgi:hypothetical protein